MCSAEARTECQVFIQVMFANMIRENHESKYAVSSGSDAIHVSANL